MNPIHRHGDPELARGRAGSRARRIEEPAVEGPAIRVIDRRAAASEAEQPAAPAPATAAQPAPSRTRQKPKTRVAAPETVPAEKPRQPAEAQPQEAKPKRGGFVGALVSIADFFTTNVLKKLKIAACASAAIAYSYQLFDNSIEAIRGTRAPLDALWGTFTDMGAGAWGLLKSAWRAISSYPDAPIFAGLFILVATSFKHARNFIKSWSSISESKKGGYHKTWEKVNESFSLLWNLSKAATVSFFICHLPSVLANYSKIFAIHKEMSIAENINNGISTLLRAAPAAAYSLFAFAGFGVLWLGVGMVRKLFDMHQESKERKELAEERARIEAEQAAPRAQDEAAHAANMAEAMRVAAELGLRIPNTGEAKPPGGSAPA